MDGQGIPHIEYGLIQAFKLTGEDQGHVTLDETQSGIEAKNQTASHHVIPVTQGRRIAQFPVVGLLPGAINENPHLGSHEHVPSEGSVRQLRLLPESASGQSQKRKKE